MLDPATLFVGQEHVLYCRVKAGNHAARFLRPAYYQLTEHVHEDAATDTFELRLGKTTYPIAFHSPRSDVGSQEEEKLKAKS